MKINTANTSKIIRNTLSIMIIIVVSALMISSESDPDTNDGSLYTLDLDDPSTYEMTCYDELLNQQWVVKNQSCTLTTSVINLPGEPGVDPIIDIPINFTAHCTGNLEANDNIVLQYTTGGEWETESTIPGTDLTEGIIEYGFRADSIPAGSSIQFRFIVQTDNSSEKITLKFTSEDNTVFVGTPFLAGTDELFRPVGLPVTLADFYGQVSEKQVLLAWKTLSEINNRHFEVERSSNGYEFNTMWNSLNINN